LKHKFEPQYCSSVFHKDAILFAARKTAGISGDIRKAFQVCRIAIENYLLQNPKANLSLYLSECTLKLPLIKMRDIQQATRDMFDSRFVSALKRCTPYEALVFVSLGALKRQYGNVRDVVSMEDLLIKMESIVNGLGDDRFLPLMNLSDLMELLNRLSEVSSRSCKHKYFSIMNAFIWICLSDSLSYFFSLD